MPSDRDPRREFALTEHGQRGPRASARESPPDAPNSTAPKKSPRCIGLRRRAPAGHATDECDGRAAFADGHYMTSALTTTAATDHEDELWVRSKRKRLRVGSRTPSHRPGSAGKPNDRAEGQEEEGNGGHRSLQIRDGSAGRSEAEQGLNGDRPADEETDAREQARRCHRNACPTMEWPLVQPPAIRAPNPIRPPETNRTSAPSPARLDGITDSNTWRRASKVAVETVAVQRDRCGEPTDAEARA
jgi:hypothetical protein